jgi:hypothetical protein
VGRQPLGRMGTAAGRLTDRQPQGRGARPYSITIDSAIRSTTAGSPLIT